MTREEIQNENDRPRRLELLRNLAEISKHCSANLCHSCIINDYCEVRGDMTGGKKTLSAGLVGWLNNAIKKEDK